MLSFVFFLYCENNKEGKLLQQELILSFISLESTLCFFFLSLNSVFFSIIKGSFFFFPVVCGSNYNTTATTFAIMPTDVRWWTFATNLFFTLLNGCKSDKIMENNLQTGDVVDNEGPLIFTKWERTSVWWWTTASLTLCWSHIGSKTKIKFPFHNSDSSRLRKKTFPRTSDESRKHRLCFPIGRGKNILPLDCFSSWSPPPPALRLCFSLRAQPQQTRAEGRRTSCCVRTAATLSLTFHCSLLDVCSFLNVTAQTECDEQNENNLKKKEKKRKRRRKCHNVLGSRRVCGFVRKTCSGEL